MLSNRYICMAFSVCMVMSFFVFPVSADEYEEYQEDYQEEYYEEFNYYDDVPSDEEPVQTELTEMIVSEENIQTSEEVSEISESDTETYFIETTVNEFEQQLTTYITAGAIKIIGEY